MEITKYLMKLGYDPVDTSFYRQIKIWESWYRSNVARFHIYKIYNGISHVKRHRHSLGMGKKVSEDIADLLLNERVAITLADEQANEYVKQVLDNNNWQVLGNEYQERKASTGTVAYVPYIDGAMIDEESGTFIHGEGRIKIDYVTAQNIFPLSWSNGKVTECAFVYPKKYKNKKYAHIQIHVNENGVYNIYNHVVETTKGEGTEVDSSQWKDMQPFAALVPVVHTGSAERQFVIDKLNIVNNYDDDNPMGIAIFANGIDQLMGCDCTYDSYVNEFILGKKRIFTNYDTLSEDADGHPAFDPNDVVFYKLPEDSANDKPITESNMQLRADEHSKALNDNLNMLSVKCGFGTEHYKFDNGNIQTATQVISENSDLYRTVKKHEIILDAVIKELVMIICRLGNVIGAGIAEDAAVTIDFDDSIIEDRASERKEDRGDLAAGIISRAEYRAKYRNETLEEAEKNLPDIGDGVSD